MAANSTLFYRGLHKRARMEFIFGAFMLVTCSSYAQDFQFTFDLTGNLLTESPVTTAPPHILSQPQPQVVGPGELASFFVAVADSRDLTYQWRFNDADIPGATEATLLLTNVGAMNEGQYSVVLVNPSGSVTSAPAALMLDSDFDRMGDGWELANFGSLTNYPTGDFDGDGVSNLTEFLDGTSPTNSASALFRLTLLSDGRPTRSRVADRSCRRTSCPNCAHLTLDQRLTSSATRRVEGGGYKVEGCEIFSVTLGRKGRKAR